MWRDRGSKPKLWISMVDCKESTIFRHKFRSAFCVQTQIKRSKWSYKALIIGHRDYYTIGVIWHYKKCKIHVNCFQEKEKDLDQKKQIFMSGEREFLLISFFFHDSKRWRKVVTTRYKQNKKKRFSPHFRKLILGEAENIFNSEFDFFFFLLIY